MFFPVEVSARDLSSWYVQHFAISSLTQRALLRRSNVCFEVAATSEFTFQNDHMKLIIRTILCTALLFYDYFMTLGDEFRCVWKRKFSGVSVLFFVARYSTLLDRGVKMVQLVSWYNYSEDTVVKVRHILMSIMVISHCDSHRCM